MLLAIFGVRVLEFPSTMDDEKAFLPNTMASSIDHRRTSSAPMHLVSTIEGGGYRRPSTHRHRLKARSIRWDTGFLDTRPPPLPASPLPRNNSTRSRYTAAACCCPHIELLLLLLLLLLAAEHGLSLDVQLSSPVCPS